MENDLTLKRRGTPPYWWPDTNTILQIFLTVSIVIMVGYILAQLLDGKFNLDPVLQNLVMVILGVILACFKDVFGYTFGSSAGQKRQGEVITKSLEDKDKIIADNVISTANVAAAAVGAGTPTDAPATIITTAPTEPSVTPTTTTVTQEAPKP